MELETRNTSATETAETIAAQRLFFNSGATRNPQMRIEALRRLRNSIIAHQNEICDALLHDLHKSPSEGYMTEIGITLSELDYHIRHLRRWCRPVKVRGSLAVFPSRSRIIYQPLGSIFILAPWNYPFQLALSPLVGAIAAGNCVALKPSTTSAATTKILGTIIEESFDPRHVSLFDGDHEQTARLLHEHFDHIFFTGGAAFGRTVMIEAAKNLTPVTLELGGKSPCIIDADADIDIAAKRTVWGKLLNAGQTCIAPDYIFVHQSVHDRFIERMKHHIQLSFGTDPHQSAIYPRIISTKAFDRLHTLIESSEGVVYGGECIQEEKYIAPTIIDNVTPDSAVMQHEIFGPIFPIMTFGHIDHVIDYVNAHDKPLALYYFGHNWRHVLRSTSSGGACVNDTIMHVSNLHLPFGGVGSSGTGRYHGRKSFETFSNPRSVLLSPRSFDVPLRYAPYPKIGLLKKFM